MAKTLRASEDNYMNHIINVGTGTVIEIASTSWALYLSNEPEKCKPYGWWVIADSFWVCYLKVFF